MRFWCRLFVVVACVLAACAGARAATTVAIEQAAPGSPSAAPASVFVRDLTVPASGATVSVFAHAQTLTQPVKLATAYLLGSHNLTGTRSHSFRTLVSAPSSVLDALARDPHATITLTIAPTGRTDALETVGPLPVSFTRPAP